VLCVWIAECWLVRIVQCRNMFHKCNMMPSAAFPVFSPCAHSTPLTSEPDKSDPCPVAPPPDELHVRQVCRSAWRSGSHLSAEHVARGWTDYHVAARITSDPVGRGSHLILDLVSATHSEILRLFCWFG